MRKLLMATLLLPMLGSAVDQETLLAGDIYLEPEFAPGAKAPKFYEESMKTRDERIQWWVDGRFGCFIHWGIYAQLGGVWQDEKVHGYSEHIQRKGQIDQATYAEVCADKFNPVDFDAEEWVKLIKAAGMRYLVITAKHHDGFAMYDSQVSDWNIVDATPFKRDPMAELKAACVKHGIKFGFYYSHAFDWGEADGPGNDWEFKNPGGDKNLGGRNWWDDPVMGKELPRIRENYVNKKSIPQVVELLKKYDPDIMWFDTPHKLPNSENWRIFKALRDTDSEVVVNGRFIYGFGDYTTTCDKPAQIKPTSEKYWEAIPTTNESYGYHSEDKSHKPAAELIQLLIKAVARGGNILMNLGPRADGKIDDPDVNILNGFAEWMTMASESIHGAGRSGLPVQAWGESTAKDHMVYLQVFDWPIDGKLRIGGLQNDPAFIHLLGADEVGVAAKRLDDNTLELNVPASPVSEASTVIALEFEADIQTSKARLLDPVALNTLNVFDGKIDGSTLKYENGARGYKADNHRDCLKGWTKGSDTVNWNLYVREAGEYEVIACYHGLKEGAGIKVELGNASVGGKTSAGADVKQPLGTFKVVVGSNKLVWRITDTDGVERFRPQALILKPVK
ncbi:alpha-L-fucosidase [Pontiellaceae bacterium B12227]|nr:alpha-L-fucosidase [Pontiellaceae bacterium B12227]